MAERRKSNGHGSNLQTSFTFMMALTVLQFHVGTTLGGEGEFFFSTFGPPFTLIVSLRPLPHHRKAFPGVWREGLWEKMKYYGIDGKFLTLCQDLFRVLYRDVSARVRVGKVFSERYTIEGGLWQGCILSPSLFFSFSHGFSWRARQRQGLGIRVRGTWMGACFFADDIVLLAESDNELQK